MFGLSFGEILFLGILALIVVGPRQLPELARQIGRFMSEIRRATDGFTNELKRQARVDLDPIDFLNQRKSNHQSEQKISEDSNKQTTEALPQVTSTSEKKDE